MAIAHAVIEYQGENGDTVRIKPGQEAPTEIPGYDDLVESGAIRDEEYDPAVEKPEAPEQIEIDGVVYVKASDGAETDASGGTE